VTSQTERSQVFILSSAFCLGCTGEGVKRRFLISNVFTGNIKLCHRHRHRTTGWSGLLLGLCFIYSVELDWYPVAGVAGRGIQVALTKDRKRLPRRRRQQIPSKHWYLYTGVHCVVS